MMRLRSIIFAMILCFCDVSIVNSYTKISLNFTTQEALALKIIHDKKIADHIEQEKDAQSKNSSFVNFIAALQQKISDTQKNIHDTYDNVMEYVYALLLLREVELLGIDGDQEQLDVRELMILYSRQDRKDRKQAKKEAKQEAKEARKKSSSGGQKNNSHSSQASCGSPLDSSSQNNSENSPQPSIDTTDKVDTSTSDTSNNDQQVNGNVLSDGLPIGSITITPNILGDFKYDPSQDPANNTTDDTNKIPEKPTQPPVEKDNETNPKIPSGMQQSIDNFGKQGPYQNNQKRNDFIQDFNEAYQQRFLQKCYESGYDKNMSPEQKDKIRQKARQDALREVDNEFKKAHEEEKAQAAAAQKEKDDKKAADQQVKQHQKEQAAADKAAKKEQKELDEAAALLDAERKKPGSQNKKKIKKAHDIVNAAQKKQDEINKKNNLNKPSGSSAGTDDVTTQKNQNTSGQNSDQPSDQNSQDSNNSFNNNSPTPPDDSDDGNNSQDPTPVAQSYWDYICSFIPSLSSGDGSQEPGDSSSSSDRDDRCSREAKNTCKMPHDVALKIRDEFNKIANFDEMHEIDFMLGCLQRAQNDMTVELAQAGLQACKDYASADSDQDRDLYQNKYKMIHGILNSAEPQLAIADQARFISQQDINTLLQEYTTCLEGHQTNHALDKKFDDVHTKRLKNRQQALIESQQQLRTNNFKDQSYDVSPQARGFMMVNQMNYAAFDQMKGTNFQHCLLQENLQIVEFASGMLIRNPYGSIIKDFTKQICNVAVSAQQLNQLGQIKEAAAITDLNHFYATFAQLTYDEEYEIQAWKNAGAGVCQGADRFLHKWAEFGQNLWNEPGQTVGQMADNLNAIGNGLLGACSVGYAHSPQAYISDYVSDFFDVITTGKFQEKNRAQVRYEQNTARINKGYSDIVTTGHAIVTNMMNKSFKDNVADFTESTLDNMIYAKMTQGVMMISHHIGNELVQAARDIKDAISPHLLGKSAKFIADEAGQLIAIAEGTGEQIALSMQASGKTLSTGPKHGLKKPKTVKGSTGKPQAPVASKPVVGSPEWKKTYPHGEFKPSAKHHQNSTGSISKPPLDGQAALNNSFAVDGSMERVAIQEGQIVILKKTAPDQYHGYIVDDFHSIKNENVQKALVENGLIKTIKSGKVIKK